jgi:hypothetical protein
LNFSPSFAGPRQTFGIGAKIDDETSHGARLVGQPQDAEAAHFEQAREGLGDFPAPETPRISTARAPVSTAEA